MNQETPTFLAPVEKAWILLEKLVDDPAFKKIEESLEIQLQHKSFDPVATLMSLGFIIQLRTEIDPKNTNTTFDELIELEKQVTDIPDTKLLDFVRSIINIRMSNASGILKMAAGIEALCIPSDVIAAKNYELRIIAMLAAEGVNAAYAGNREKGLHLVKIAKSIREEQLALFSPEDN